MRRFSVFALLLFLTACATESGPACVQVENASLPVIFTAQGLPIVDVVVAGQTLHMLVDTGAEMTFVTPAAAKRFPSSFIFGGMERVEGENGGLDSQARAVQRMRLGGIEVEDEALFVSNIFINDNQNNEIQGILGEDILQNYNIGLDFPQRRLDLFARGGCISAFPWSGQFARLSFPDSHNGPRITFYIDDKPIVGMLDSGASRLVIRQNALTEAGVISDQIGGTSRSVGLGALTGTDILEQFDTLTIGGEMLASPWIRVAPKADFGQADALIGENYLHTHRVYINNDTHTVWLGMAMAPDGTVLHS